VKHQSRAHRKQRHRVEYSRPHGLRGLRGRQKSPIPNFALQRVKSCSSKLTILVEGYSRTVEQQFVSFNRLAKAGGIGYFAYLFAKNDRGNITPNELLAFRKLANDYAGTSNAGITLLLKNKDLLEICHD
jgi:hypothetical protein